MYSKFNINNKTYAAKLTFMGLLNGKKYSYQQLSIYIENEACYLKEGDSTKEYKEKSIEDSAAKATVDFCNQAWELMQPKPPSSNPDKTSAS